VSGIWHTRSLSIGDRPFPDLRCVPEAGRPKQQVENYERAWPVLRSLSYGKQSWDFFTFKK
jgi:hypothetical protein